MECAVCKGSGKITYVVATGKGDGEMFEMGCVWCDRTGQMTESQCRSYVAAQEMWCRCGNPSGNSTYHPDEPGSKHHWTCDDCGKVTQIG